MGNWTPNTVLDWVSKNGHGNGPQAYLLGMADNEMVFTGSYNGYSQPLYDTPWYEEVDTLNSFVGYSYYALVTSPSDRQWWSEMNTDEGSSPYIPEVFDANTTYLGNWGNDQGQSHLITTTSVGENGNGNVKYYDTATSYSSGGSTLGFHNIPRSQVDGQAGGLEASIW
jgi:hypothetical protein